MSTCRSRAQFPYLETLEDRCVLNATSPAPDVETYERPVPPDEAFDTRQMPKPTSDGSEPAPWNGRGVGAHGDDSTVDSHVDAPTSENDSLPADGLDFSKEFGTAADFQPREAGAFAARYESGDPSGTGSTSNFNLKSFSGLKGPIKVPSAAVDWDRLPEQPPPGEERPDRHESPWVADPPPAVEPSLTFSLLPAETAEKGPPDAPPELEIGASQTYALGVDGAQATKATPATEPGDLAANGAAWLPGEDRLPASVQLYGVGPDSWSIEFGPETPIEEAETDLGGAGAVLDRLTCELAGLEAAVRNFFDQFDRLGQEWTAWPTAQVVLAWAAGLAAAAAAVEIGRRQIQPARRKPSPRLFGLAGCLPA